MREGLPEPRGEMLGDGANGARGDSALGQKLDQLVSGEQRIAALVDEVRESVGEFVSLALELDKELRSPWDGELVESARKETNNHVGRTAPQGQDDRQLGFYGLEQIASLARSALEEGTETVNAALLGIKGLPSEVDELVMTVKKSQERYHAASQENSRELEALEKSGIASNHMGLRVSGAKVRYEMEGARLRIGVQGLGRMLKERSTERLSVWTNEIAKVLSDMGKAWSAYAAELTQFSA